VVLKTSQRSCETMELTAIAETLATNFICDNEGAAQGLLEHFVSRPKVISAAHAFKRFTEVPLKSSSLIAPKKQRSYSAQRSSPRPSNKTVARSMSPANSEVLGPAAGSP